MKKYSVKSLINQSIPIITKTLDNKSITVNVPTTGLDLWEVQISADVKTKVKNGILKLTFLEELEPEIKEIFPPIIKKKVARPVPPLPTIKEQTKTAPVENKQKGKRGRKPANTSSNSRETIKN